MSDDQKEQKNITIAVPKNLFLWLVVGVLVIALVLGWQFVLKPASQAGTETIESIKTQNTLEAEKLLIRESVFKYDQGQSRYMKVLDVPTNPIINEIPEDEFFRKVSGAGPKGIKIIRYYKVKITYVIDTPYGDPSTNVITDYTFIAEKNGEIIDGLELRKEGEGGFTKKP